MPKAAELQAKLKLLGNAYAVQLPEKLHQIESLWNDLSQSEWEEEKFIELHRMVHSLAGSGKTFGFATLSVAARDLEECLKPFAKTKPDAAGCKTIGEKISALPAEAIQQHQDCEMIAITPESVPSNRRVFVVEYDVELAAELKTQLSYFGYEVSVFHKLDEFRCFMQNNPEGVVLMDINFPEDSMGVIRVMSELQQGSPVPVIFLFGETGFNCRLEAVRAGSIAYLTKPVNIGALIDKLDELTSNRIAVAYRVLIVDDSASLADFYAAALEQAGMTVMVVTDPLEVMKPLFDFVPDLILVDMYMPGCSGMELAKIIRQIDDFTSIPIVFLSAETSLGKQQDAMELGGDDFLTKPIVASHLVSSVTNRIRRSLLLRSFMVRDSLTGLLNHTTIKDQLAREMARAKRQDKPLAFAMIDIDHFKLVNDGYGHPAGDRVIKSLSRLLKQRLRENDIVGRYGGEEFAVILIDADASSASRILDGIRNDFSHLRHLSGDQEFLVTFSAGVVDNSVYGDASKLTDAADKALYKAKHAGRNQVAVVDG